MADKMIVGLFKNPEKAASASDALVAAGIHPDRLSVVVTEPTAKESFGIDTHSKMPEGFAVGSGFGAAAGALLGGLTATGVVLTGGTALLAVGPVVAAFAGAGVGATGGGILGALVGYGFPEAEVKHYENALEEGGVLLGVIESDQDDGDRIEEILKNHDADDVTRK